MISGFGIWELGLLLLLVFFFFGSKKIPIIIKRLQIEYQETLQ